MLRQEIEKRSEIYKKVLETFFIIFDFRSMSRASMRNAAENLKEQYPRDITDVESLVDEFCNFRGYVEAQQELRDPADYFRHLSGNRLLAHSFPFIPWCNSSSPTVLHITVHKHRGPTFVFCSKTRENELRSTMSHERLSNLAVLSIESTITNSLDYDQVIASFAAAKARKTPV